MVFGGTTTVMVNLLACTVRKVSRQKVKDWIIFGGLLILVGIYACRRIRWKKSGTIKKKLFIHSDLPTCQQLRKKVLFYFQKLSSVPVTQLRRKSLQVLRFSHDLIRLFIKKLKKFHKKNIFSIILLAIILLPLKYPI